MLAVITIDSIDKSEPGYIHFKDKSQKAWNCNKEELIPNFVVGERYFIDYNETEPKGGRKYGSKYINRARFWKEEDGPNTWPDKEPHTGGGGLYTKSGGTVPKRDTYDPEVGKHQTTANCAMTWCAANVKTVDELVLIYPVVYQHVFQTAFGKPAMASDGSETGAGSNAPADEDFHF